MAALPIQFVKLVAEIRQIIQYNPQLAHTKCQSLWNIAIAIPKSNNIVHNDQRFLMIETLRVLRTEIALEISSSRRSASPPPPPPKTPTPSNVVPLRPKR
jgi:hypothetical protein